MTVGEKLRYLRTIEGTLRGLDREMTQQAVSAALESELGVKMSQAYLSQIERGQRRHLTNTTRMALSRFFKVHPGYLVDDPEGFHTELTSDVRTTEDNLDLWLISGAERFADPEIREALIKLAMHPDTRRCLALVGAILETPGLAERLLDVLRPELAETPRGRRPDADTAVSADVRQVPDRLAIQSKRGGKTK